MVTILLHFFKVVKVSLHMLCELVLWFSCLKRTFLGFEQHLPNKCRMDRAGGDERTQATHTDKLTDGRAGGRAGGRTGGTVGKRGRGEWSVGDGS